MKKVFYLLAIACILVGFTSCNKDKKIDVGYAVNIEVDPYNVINGFTPVSDGDFNMYSGDVLRITLLAYDANGALVQKDIKYVLDYSKKADFSIFLEEGKYTFIAISDVYTPSQDYSYWSVDLEETLSMLQINEIHHQGHVDNLLGLRMYNQEVKKSCKIKIELKPVTSLLVINMLNIHKYDNIGNILHFTVRDMSLRVTVNDNGFNYSCPEYGYMHFLNQINTNDYQTGVWGYYVILPTNKECFVILRDSDNNLYRITDEVQYSFKVGKQYIINADITTGTVDIEEFSKGKSMNVSEGFYSNKIIDIISNNPSFMQQNIVK